MIPKAELKSFLEAVKAGEITLEAQQDPQEVYAGNVEYKANNGWTLVVFNDCNEYDYIDMVRASDGREIDFDDIYNDCHAVFSYDAVSWRRLGIPGYVSCRCVKCGAEIRLLKENVFLCGDGRCDKRRVPPEPTLITIRAKVDPATSSSASP